MAILAESLFSLDRDPLTGLADARALGRLLQEWCDDAVQGEATSLHAMLIGLGRFDAVNLAYGVAAGDGALVEVARRIMHLAGDELVDGQWFAARAGGGQFALVSRERVSRERWHWLGEALGAAVAAPIAAIDGSGTVRLWPRVALMRVLPGESGPHILDRLAATLAGAHDRPGARLAWTDRTVSPAGIRAAEIEADVLGAVDRNEIEVVFQPQFSLADGSLVGGEALARWRHPRVGSIGASSLFAIAERADHVAQLSRHIAETALKLAQAWPSNLHLSINLTPADLSELNFASDFCNLVRASGFPADRITLEITEQVLLCDLEGAARALAQLRCRGMRIALDDFGGGFCNFRYLKHLELDALKLDRSMIIGIETDERDRAVLRAIVALARALGLTVVAEGIETEEQRVIAKAEGCEIFQGFLGSPPLAAEDFRSLARG